MKVSISVTAISDAREKHSEANATRELDVRLGTPGPQGTEGNLEIATKTAGDMIRDVITTASR